MNKLGRHTTLAVMMILVAVQVDAARPTEWTAAVEVWHDESLCISYRARVDGAFLVVRATGGVSLYNLSPCRVVDTRQPPGAPPVDGIVESFV
jgi:hypothetical protein